MMASRVSVEVKGLEITIEALGKVTNAITRKYARRGVTKAASVVSKAVKSKLVVGHGLETGLLKKSIGFRVYTSKDGIPGAVIGPRRGFKEPVTGRKRGRARLLTKRQKAAGVAGQSLRNPIKYAHLVEFGHGGKHPAGPHPFMRPAYEETKYDVEFIVGEEIHKGIESEGGK